MYDEEVLLWFSQLPTHDVRLCLQFLKQYKDKPGAEKLFENLTKRRPHARLMRALVRGFIGGKEESKKSGIPSIKVAHIKNLFKGRFIESEENPSGARPYQFESEADIAVREKAAFESWCEVRQESGEPVTEGYQTFARQRAQDCAFQKWEQREPSFEPKKGLRKKDKTNGGNVFDFSSQA